MKNKSFSTSDFMNYINSPINISVIEKLYEENNINIEYCDLFYDFIITLTNLIVDSYFGDEIMTPKNRREHFEWAFNYTVKQFEKENIFFTDNADLKIYFANFLGDVFYDNKLKNEILLDNMLKLWRYMFNHNISKSRLDVDTMIEIYKMFKKSLFS